MACNLMFIGHVSIDRVENQHGVRVQAGGAALYAAIAAKILLKDVTLVSAIGKDFKFMDTLRPLGINHVKTFSVPSTTFNIKYNKLGEAEYLKASHGAGSKLTASTIRTQLLTPETIVHISPLQPIKVEKIVKKIRKTSPETRISINTWIGYIKSPKNRKILKNLALEADFFILNDHEAKALTETDSISTALTLLKSKMLIITLGNIGAIIGEKGTGVQMIPALHTPGRDVIDTTGAGDVWCGAFLASFKLTEDLLKSVTIASILSSIKCSGWNFQKLINLKFRNPDEVIEYVIGMKEGAFQKKIFDYTT
ncbi:MAG: carbohydrate kinase family protein [Candidatus Bathyarchaeota archaeon]|nr:carbohydrate kinase family protein [Candidatus Bathyarchaeota archaeon]